MRKKKPSKQQKRKLHFGFTLLSVMVVFIITALGVGLIATTLTLIMEGKPSYQTLPNAEMTSALSTDIPSTIIKFRDYAELQKFLSEKSLTHNNVAYWDMGGSSIMPLPPMQMPMVGLEESMGTSSDTKSIRAGYGGGADYSGTNIQVEGVDEADIVKTDGKYIYSISQNNVFIVNAYPAASSEILAKIAFLSPPQNIFIDNERLIVYGSDNAIYDQSVYKNFIRKSPFSYVKIFDVSNPADPELLRDFDFEGNITDARMIGEFVYLVTQAPVDYYKDEPPIPRILENGKEMPTNSSAMPCNCPEVYIFDPFDTYYNYTSVVSINASDITAPVNNEVYLLTQGQTIYVSSDNIYITYTKRIRPEALIIETAMEFLTNRLDEAARTRIAEIQSVSNFILSPDQKISKIGDVIERYVNTLSSEEQQELQAGLKSAVIKKYEDVSKELEKTIIHKIAINKDTFNYSASGEVPGYVLNQFSMDEKDGYFRIATTRSREWRSVFDGGVSESYNNLYILDGNLNVSGKIEELAASERIYSVRFMQDRAYMVTFRQMDPLFVIDLKNPRSPRVLGELKIPGFSEYLHPYDNNTLIGIGRDADESGRTKGLKISLFDVRNVEDPKEISSYIFQDPSSSSIAEHDHKAFLFSKEKNLLVIPVTIYGNSAPIPFRETPQEDMVMGRTSILPPQTSGFHGAYVFTVDGKEISLKGTIDHSQLFQNDYEYMLTVKRSLYIDDTLYTISDLYIKMNTIESLDTVKNLRLEKNSEKDFDIVK